MREEIARLTSTSMPSSLTELITLGRTLKRRATDILAYFDHPPHQQRPHRSHQRTPSNTYAAPPQDLRNLTHYITRSLLGTGGFKPQLHPQL